MRRTAALTVAGVTLAVATALLPGIPTFADETTPAVDSPAVDSPAVDSPAIDSPAIDGTEVSAAEAAQADRALAVAARVLAGDPAAADPSPTMALLDLRLSMPDLSPPERRGAQTLVARPTDGPADVLGDGYSVPSVKKCSAHVCVHWVSTTADAPPAGWADETLRQLTKVWDLEVTALGYRPPLGDGRRGGNSKLDVYLKDIGSKGFYGYCYPERAAYGYTFSGYCVLDNDFEEFPLGPLPSLKVTAAHEFFHAIQYAYDAAEDGWFMESTATWMEERFADGVDDNLQYLPYGQLGNPQSPLDTYVSGGSQQYGNWAWWEYLSTRYGTGIVKSVWRQAGAYRGAPDSYSTQALVSVLRAKGGFRRTFGAYAAGNTAPAASYEEGASWPAAGAVATHTLGPSSASIGPRSVTVHHMAAKSVRIVPSSGLSEPDWALELSIDGPNSETAPAVVALTTKLDGSVSRRTITLDSRGVGTVELGFSADTVSSVTLTMANASTRFVCWRGTDFSCRGRPRDNGRSFAYTARASQR